jgi:quinol monooxygenase YgiN
MEEKKNINGNHPEKSPRAFEVIEEWKRRRAEDIRLFEEKRKTPAYKKMIEELKKKNESKSNSPA